MQENNPYSTPSANLNGRDSFTQEQTVTQGVVEQLAKTKGWTRFIGVLSIIMGGLFIFVISLGSATVTRVGLGTTHGEILAVGFALYLVLGGLYLVIGLKLNGFSSAITRLIYSGKERDLEDALNRQRSFWMFTGILSIIFLIIAVAGMLASQRIATAAIGVHAESTTP